MECEVVREESDQQQQEEQQQEQQQEDNEEDYLSLVGNFELPKKLKSPEQILHQQAVKAAKKRKSIGGDVTITTSNVQQQQQEYQQQVKHQEELLSVTISANQSMLQNRLLHLWPHHCLSIHQYPPLKNQNLRKHRTQNRRRRK